MLGTLLKAEYCHPWRRAADVYSCYWPACSCFLSTGSNSSW